MNKRDEDFDLDTLRSANVQQAHEQLNKLYLSLWPSASNFMKSYLSDEKDIEDVYQDSMIVLYKKLRDPEFSLASSVKTFLFAIIKNNIRNLRRKMNKVTEELDLNIPDKNNLEADMMLTERNQYLINKLQELGEACQKVLKLFYFEKISMAEIAVTLGYANAQVAKNKKVNCIKKLRSNMDISKFRYNG